MPTPKRNIKQAPIVQAFAGRLKALRASRNVTQKELATKAHIALTYVSKLEAGGAAPGIDMLERIAKALGANVTDLLPTPEGEGASKEEVKKLFEALMQNAGPETLSMLKVFMTRLSESSGTKC